MLRRGADTDVRAAGGVVWRVHKSRAEVALVHRPRYDDWSLPKGKLDDGETELAGAVREVAEELGSHVAVSRRIGNVTYAVPGGRKSVTYWVMRHVDGEFRPGHFEGVATVVAKLFHIVEPDVAVFGEKDFQQLTIIRRMVADLCLAVAIVAAPTVREPDGLAMSSRNQYLTEDERRTAPVIHGALLAAVERLRAGDRDFAAIERSGLEALERAGLRPDYFSVRRADDLSGPDADTRRLVVLTAARLGRARLIDNLQPGT